MFNRTWRLAVDSAPEPERVRSFVSRLMETSASSWFRKASKDQARVLTALLTGSLASGELLVANPEWISLLDLEDLAKPRYLDGLRRAAEFAINEEGAGANINEALEALRHFKQMEMVRLALRDLGGFGEMEGFTRELSDLADVCLEIVTDLCWRRESERIGLPYHESPSGRWVPTSMAVIALGKLGGHELNYSSDVDLMFIYDEEGVVSKVPPGKNALSSRTLASHQFFRRVAEGIIAETAKNTGMGMLYRIDMRLRPEGAAGPLARSLASYENYYAQSGQTWERLMLSKARVVAGSTQLGGEFLEVIESFRYPRSVGERIFREVAAVKQRIEREVLKPGELERNVKLGRGGIREIEFVAQSLQLVHAGKHPFLRGAQTVPALESLARYRLLPGADSVDLVKAYIFLRNLEHRLQMENYQQTHTIPTDRRNRARLARLMGFESLDLFEAAWEGHRSNVRRVYDHVFGAHLSPEAGRLPPDFSPPDRWLALLDTRGFRDPQQALKRVQTMVEGPGYIHVSSRTREMASELLEFFLDRCPGGKTDLPAADRLSDPDRVLTRLESFVSAYGARATLYAAWLAKPGVFKLLLLLMDRSEYLAEVAISTPDLIDEIELSGHLRRAKKVKESLLELRAGAEDSRQTHWLRRYQQAELMRIGLRDILGFCDLDQTLGELTSLAEACIEYALEVATRSRRGKGRGLAIIGFGKLGGHEINYGSDLDVMFVTEGGETELPSWLKTVADLIELMDTRASGAPLMMVDARLRPDGEKGLLANSVQAYRHYYETRAMLWEIQTLTRARVVAGDREVGERFMAMARELADLRRPRVSCFTVEWKREIRSMRERIEQERTPPGQDHLAIKTGSGGLIDAEFVAQIYCLETGWSEPNTMLALKSAEEKAWLPREVAHRMIENYARLRQVEAILRRWSFRERPYCPSMKPRRSALHCGVDFRTRGICCWRLRSGARRSGSLTRPSSLERASGTCVRNGQGA